MKRNHEILVLMLILLIGIVLRYQRCGWEPISLDEMWHLALSTGHGSPQISLPRDQLIERLPSVTDMRAAAPWWTIPANFAEATHPPLHVLLLRGWRAIFGSTDLAAQYSSFFASVVAIGIVWLAARTAFDSVTGLWTAALMAVAPTQVYFAQEIRSYALLVALGGWGLWVMARIDRHGATRGRVIELATAALAMMLTHYFAIAACVAIGVFVLIRQRGRDRIEAIVALAIAAFLFAVLWGPFVPGQLQYVSQARESFLSEQSSNWIALALMRFAVLPVRLIAEMTLSSAAWVVIGILMYLAPLPFLRRKSSMLPWILWLGCSMLFLLLLDITRGTRHMTFVRYAMLATPALYGTIMATLSALRPSVYHAAAAAVVAASLYFSLTAYTPETPGYDVLRTALRETVDSGDVLIFYSGASSELHTESLFLAASCDPYLWPRSVVMLTRTADSNLIGRLRGAHVTVLSGPLTQPIESVMPSAVAIEQMQVVDEMNRHLATLTRAEIPQEIAPQTPRSR